MQLDDTPLQPGRAYLYQVDGIERQVRVRRIRIRQGRWFAIGVDLDRQAACSFWIDNVQKLRPVHAG